MLAACARVSLVISIPPSMRAISSRRVAAQREHAVGRADAVAGFLHLEVLVALRRHLRQMGHAQHLARGAQGAQLLPDHLGHRAADTGIHLVEDQGRHVVQAEGRHLDGQADARELATRRHLAQRAVPGPDWR